MQMAKNKQPVFPSIAKKRRKMPTSRVLFILFCVAIPVIQWLVFYVYTNISAILMAFQGSHGEFSLVNFERFFHELSKPTSLIREAFRNTFLTFAIQVVSFPFQVLVAYFIYKKILFYRFFRTVFFLPGIIFSVAWSLIFLNVIGVEGPIAKAVGDIFNLGYVPELLVDSRFANSVILINMVWLAFPGDLIIWGGTFARIPEEVLESAKIDGVTWIKEFTKIILPMVWPTVGLKMVLMICGVFGASGAVFLLTQGNYGTMTLSCWMYLQLLNSSGNQFTSNVYNYLSAVGLILTVVSVAIAVVVRKFVGKVFEEVEY